MSDTNTGGPAFPINANESADRCIYIGMTLRDYFAAKAMQGELASQQEGYAWHSNEKLAKHCYNIADAMLEERGNHDR